MNIGKTHPILQFSKGSKENRRTKYTTKSANILPKVANLPDYKLDEKEEEPRIPHTQPEVNIWQKILKETSDKAALESSSKKSLMEMLSDEPLNGDTPSSDQMAIEKVDTPVEENFDNIFIYFVFHGSSLKWTVLGQSGRSRRVKLDGPND